MTDPLKPCCFCGATGDDLQVYQRPDYPIIFVECLNKDCGAMGPVVQWNGRDDPEAERRAKELWNRRLSDERVGRRIADLIAEWRQSAALCWSDQIGQDKRVIHELVVADLEGLQRALDGPKAGFAGPLPPSSQFGEPASYPPSRPEYPPVASLLDAQVQAAYTAGALGLEPKGGDQWSAWIRAAEGFKRENQRAFDLEREGKHDEALTVNWAAWRRVEAELRRVIGALEKVEASDEQRISTEDETGSRAE